MSEFLFHTLSVFGKKSPLSIKMSGEIGMILTNEQPHLILKYFEYIRDDLQVIDESVRLMSKYNLLPNDALSKRFKISLPILLHQIEE